MLSRRSLFSLFAGVGAIAAGAKVVEATPLQPVWLKDMIDPGVYEVAFSPMTTVDLPSHTHTITDPTHSHSFSGVDCTKPCTMARIIPRGMIVSDGTGRLPDLVSLGDGTMIPLDSPEGQAVLKSISAPNSGRSRW